MSKSKVSFNKNWRIFLCVVFLAAIVYIIVRNINVFGNVLIVLIGFGAVVLFHEFGHFIVAKLSDIKVEAFSIFMPPTLLGVRKTENGFRFRILPGLFSTESDESDDSQETSDESGASRVGETEYRIGLIPFGGFVKMLGQDDTGPIKNNDDPRSFANKPVRTRIPIIAAGVTFNFISAIIIFMVVFLVGINLPPAVVGEVAPDSSAERAGLRPGDEVIEIAGKSKDLDFSNISIAAALSGKGQEIPLTVKHEDGSVEQFGLVAEQLPGQPLKAFGIGQPASLTIAKISDPNTLIEKTGLQHEDHITHVNGKDVQSYWQMEEIVKNTFAESVTLTAERIVSGEVNKIETQVRLTPDIEQDEVDISHVYFMVPRLRIFAVSSPRISILDKLLIKIGIKEKGVDEKAGLISSLILKDENKCLQYSNTL